MASAYREPFDDTLTTTREVLYFFPVHKVRLFHQTHETVAFDSGETTWVECPKLLVEAGPITLDKLDETTAIGF